MKIIIACACVLLLTLACVNLASSQDQKQASPQTQPKKGATANRPPKIESFEHSPAAALLPCPTATAASECAPPGQLAIRLTVLASDPEGGELTYKYSVAAGVIEGEGSEVVWNLAGAAPGSYEARVRVEDGHGGKTSRSTVVDVKTCDCHIPCPTLELSCTPEVEEGQPATFSVKTSGGAPDLNPTYNWSVSAGTITKGQGTTTLEVDTAGLGGTKVTATLEVGGFAPECDRARSCDVRVRSKN